MAKESFQSRGHLGWRSFFWLITALLGYLLLAVTSSNSGPESFIQDRSLKLSQVDFCFNVNLTPNPDCNMIDGVLYAYRRSGSYYFSVFCVVCGPNP